MKKVLALILTLTLLVGGGFLFNPATSEAAEIQPRIPVTDGPVYTWEYIGSYKTDNVAYNTLNQKALQIVSVGFGASVIGKWITSNFLKGVAGFVSAGAVKKIPKGKNSYWTVKKYVDYDSKYYYVKQDVKVYSDKARTKLVYSTFTIDKGLK